ncbi:IDEAL domain-containing protein [Paenibacillus sp. GP183]|nr:IDEAL domain-containing protein [Paenibacillus sp. GP183]
MKQTQIQPGDWVSGTTVHDERIRGYVETISKNLESALVRVTQSDRERIVGRVSESLVSKLELLKVDAGLDERSLYNLIDIALSARDKQWFTELTSSLEALHAKKDKSDQQQTQSYTTIPHRRFWMG